MDREPLKLDYAPREPAKPLPWRLVLRLVVAAPIILLGVLWLIDGGTLLIKGQQGFPSIIFALVAFVLAAGIIWLPIA